MTQNYVIKEIRENIKLMDTAAFIEAQENLEELANDLELNDLATNDRTAILIRALEFYANGDWHDEYPCGVKINDDTLDFGNTAKDALKKYKSRADL